MRNRKSGFSVLDILIVILIIAVIAAILIPQKRQAINEQYQTESRFRLVILNEAMDQYYKTAGGEIDINQIVETDDSADVEELEVHKDAVGELTDEEMPDSLKPKRLYTDDFEDLQDFLPDEQWIEKKARLLNYEVGDITEFYPENFQPTSYPKIQDIRIYAQDSTYYVLYDPNGHGTVLNGKFLWKEE